MGGRQQAWPGIGPWLTEACCQTNIALCVAKEIGACFAYGRPDTACHGALAGETKAVMPRRRGRRRSGRCAVQPSGLDFHLVLLLGTIARACGNTPRSGYTQLIAGLVADSTGDDNIKTYKLNLLPIAVPVMVFLAGCGLPVHSAGSCQDGGAAIAESYACGTRYACYCERSGIRSFCRSHRKTSVFDSHA